MALAFATPEPDSFTHAVSFTTPSFIHVSSSVLRLSGNGTFSAPNSAIVAFASGISSAAFGSRSVSSRRGSGDVSPRNSTV